MHEFLHIFQHTLEHTASSLPFLFAAYLLIEFNEAQFSTKYVEEQGLPAVVKKTLGECEGFTQASNPILDGIPCTEAEKERIRTALASGLIFKNPVTPP